MIQQDTHRYLLFTLQGDTYAIDLQQVAEVVEVPAMSPIPRAPAYYIGAMNSHGSIKAVLDVARMQYTGSTDPGGKIIVLEDRVAGLALLVDGVLSVVSPGTLVSLPAGEDEKWCEWLLSDGNKEIRLLSVDKLLQLLEATINGNGMNTGHGPGSI